MRHSATTAAAAAIDVASTAESATSTQLCALHVPLTATDSYPGWILEAESMATGLARAARHTVQDRWSLTANRHAWIIRTASHEMPRNWTGLERLRQNFLFFWPLDDCLSASSCVERVHAYFTDFKHFQTARDFKMSFSSQNKFLEY